MGWIRGDDGICCDPLPGNTSEHIRPDQVQARRLCADAGIKWGGGQGFVGEALGGEVIGIEVAEDV